MEPNTHIKTNQGSVDSNNVNDKVHFVFITFSALHFHTCHNSNTPMIRAISFATSA